MSEHSEANRQWENQVEEFRQTNSYRELLGIDGEPIAFEWNIFPWLTSLEILLKNPEKICKIETLNLRILKIESSSGQCSMTQNGHRKEIQNNVFQIAKMSRSMRRDSREDFGHSSALETNSSGAELWVKHPKRNGIPQSHRWWNDSKKLVTQCSRASVLWIAELRKERISGTP